MAKKTKTTAINSNGTHGVPIFVSTRFDESEFARRRATLELYDDMIIQTRYDVAGRVVDSYLVDPLDIAMRLSNLSISTGQLPRNCLFYQLRHGQPRIGVLVEPRVWTVRISGEKELWRVPLPAMVFVGESLEYSLWALSGHNWPKPETALFVAPCSNVSSGVCRGNAPFPVAGPGTIWQAWDVFIESEFNRHLDNGKSRTRKDTSIIGIWRELHEAGAAEYPTDDLVQTTTLGAVMEVGR